MKTIIAGIFAASLMATNLNAMKRLSDNEINPLSKRQKQTTAELKDNIRASERLYSALDRDSLDDVKLILKDGGAEISSEYYYSFNFSTELQATHDFGCIYLIQSPGSDMVTAHYYDGTNWQKQSIFSNDFQDIKNLISMKNFEDRCNAKYIHTIVSRFNITPPLSIALGIALENATSYGKFEIFKHILTMANSKISVEDKGRVLLSAIQKKLYNLSDFLISSQKKKLGEKYILLSIAEALKNGKFETVIELLLPILKEKGTRPGVLEGQRELVFIKAAELGKLDVIKSIMTDMRQNPGNWAGITQESEGKALLSAAHQGFREVVVHILSNPLYGIKPDYCWLLAEPSMKYEWEDILQWIFKQNTYEVTSRVLTSVFKAAVSLRNLNVLEKLPLSKHPLSKLDDEKISRISIELAIAPARSLRHFDIISYLIKKTGHRLSGGCLGGILQDAAENKDLDLVLFILDIPGFYNQDSAYARIRALDLAFENEDFKMVEAIMNFSLKKLEKEDSIKYEEIMALKTQDISVDKLTQIIGNSWSREMITWLFNKLPSIPRR